MWAWWMISYTNLLHTITIYNVHVCAGYAMKLVFSTAILMHMLKAFMLSWLRGSTEAVNIPLYNMHCQPQIIFIISNSIHG